LEGFDLRFGWRDGFSHAILALIFLIATIIAWKKPFVGGWLFIFLSIFLSFFLDAWQWSQIIIVIFPFIVGILFLIEYIFKSKGKIF
jgi:ABC-type multidrug transport system fused ATPase/permease subunit